MSNSNNLPNKTDLLHDYLSKLDTSYENKIMEYENALTMITNDMYSLLIFLDYIDLIIYKKQLNGNESVNYSFIGSENSNLTDEYDSIENLFIMYRSRFKSYHSFWKRYLDFFIFYKKREFKFVFEKMIKFISNTCFEGKEDVLEYFLMHREEYEVMVKNKQRLFLANHSLHSRYSKKSTSYNSKESIKTTRHILSTPIKKSKNYSVQHSNPDSQDFYNIFVSKQSVQENSSEINFNKENGNNFIRDTDKIQNTASFKKENTINNDLFEKEFKINEESNSKQIKKYSQNYDTTDVFMKNDDFKFNEEENIKNDLNVNNSNIYNNTYTNTINKENDNFNHNISDISNKTNSLINDIINKPTQEGELIPLIQNTQPLNTCGNFYSNCFMFKQKKCMFLQNIGKGGFSRVQMVLVENQIFALKRVYKGDYHSEVKMLEKLKNLENSSNFVISMVDYNINKQEDSLDILFEYGEIDLQKYIMTNNYSDIFIKYISHEILKIISFLHDNSIVHKDIKPCNFVFVKNKLKVIDFGISTCIGPDTSSCLNSKEGTFCYSAPEIFSKQKISKAADVWSFGAVLYFLVYKRTVFVLEEVQEMYQSGNMYKEVSFRKEDRNGKEVEEKLLDLMKICLRKEPKERMKAREILSYHPYYYM
ncbi:MPS1 [Ecytonucleospora hepatopenaei]|uniref:MPS1 n=1 Tax=Ecytonucleospora hepatopenaei TaxID=646526 RepID=A0A1W0E3T7_9MICR|nr:MPS1 [Ecytonucleospora hepatopenaei]